MQIRYHVALGSNLQDRLSNLRAGVHAIHQLPDTQVTAAAPLYETDPVDCPPGSQTFYNSVIEVLSAFEPETLLRELRHIEARLGRPNVHEHHAPRTIDLDILCASSLVMNTPTLTLPHPRMTQRLFVLQPLADLQPDLVLPGQTCPVSDLLRKLLTNEAPLRWVASGDQWAQLA